MSTTLTARRPSLAPAHPAHWQVTLTWTTPDGDLVAPGTPLQVAGCGGDLFHFYEHVVNPAKEGATWVTVLSRNGEDEGQFRSFRPERVRLAGTRRRRIRRPATTPVETVAAPQLAADAPAAEAPATARAPRPAPASSDQDAADDAALLAVLGADWAGTPALAAQLGVSTRRVRHAGRRLVAAGQALGRKDAGQLQYRAAAR